MKVDKKVVIYTVQLETKGVSIRAQKTKEKIIDPQKVFPVSSVSS